jgi:hypothetical protein
MQEVKSNPPIALESSLCCTYQMQRWARLLAARKLKSDDTIVESCILR